MFKSLLTAITDGDITSIKQLIANKIDINQPCSNGELPLQVAIRAALGVKTDDYTNFLTIIDLFLTIGADPNFVKINNQPLLIYLCQFCDRDHFLVWSENDTNTGTKKVLAQVIIKKLFAGSTVNLDLNVRNDQGQTPLLIAISFEMIEMAELLLAHGADATAIDSYGRTALHLIDSKENLEFAKNLIKHGVDINAENTRGDTVLESSHDPDIVLFLLQHGAKNQKKDMLAFFQIAERNNHQPLLDYLISQGLIRYQNKSGENALHYTSSKLMLERLLQEGALTFIDQSVNSPLFSSLNHCLNNERLTQFIELYASYGANFAVTNRQGNTLLHNSYAYDKGAINRLIELGVPVNTQNNQKETALHVCAQWCHLEGIEILLAADADPMIKNDNGEVALEKFKYSQATQVAAFSVYICSRILQKLLSVLPQGYLPSNAEDLLCIAIHCDDLTSIKQLYNKGMSLVKKTQFQGKSALELAASKNRLSMLMWMLPIIGQEEYATQVVIDAIGAAITQYNYEVIKLLLNAGANCDMSTSQNKTLLEIFIDCLWQLPKNPFTGENKFEAANKTLNLLFSFGLDVNLKNKEGKTALEQLIPSNSLDSNWSLLIFLIKKGAVLPPDKRLLVRLAELAVKHQDARILQLIIEFDFVKPWRVALLVWLARIAVVKVDLELLSQLLEWGLPLQRQIFSAGSNKSRYLIEEVFHLSDYIGQHEDIVERRANQQKLGCFLIQHGTPLHYPTLEGYSLLHRAVQQGLVEVVRLLLQPEKGFDIETTAEGSSKKTPLQVAVEEGEVAVAQLLLERGANAFILNRQGQTLLHLACENGNVDMVRLLLATSIDKEATCQNYMFPNQAKAIHLAINYRDKTIAQQLVALLLQNGAKIDLSIVRTAIFNHVDVDTLKCMVNGFTLPELIEGEILRIAVRANHPLACQLLLEQWPELINSKDNLGRTPLHYATFPKRQAIFTYLLKNGSKSDICDNQGYTAAIYALFYGTLEKLDLKLEQSFNLIEFHHLHARLIDNSEFTDCDSSPELMFSLSHCCYKLIRIFEQADLALKFIEQYINRESNQPIHDLCLFELPHTSSWHRQAWAELLLSNRIEITPFLHWAARIEELLGRAPSNLSEVKAIAQQIRYSREAENLQLAELFIHYHIPELAFNRVLDGYRPKEKDMLPDVFIDGISLGHPRFYLKKLSVNDPRGFILGALTHCCQSVGSAGEACAMHGMTSSYGGFYVVFKRGKPEEILKIQTILRFIKEANNNPEAFLNQLKEKSQRNKYKALLAQAGSLTALSNELEKEFLSLEEGEIVAQTWAWLSANGALVLDSWERLRIEDDQLCLPFIKELAKQVLQRPGINHVLLGKNGQTPTHLLAEQYELVTPEHPQDYYSYRDSQQQYLIASVKHTLPLAPLSASATLTSRIGLFGQSAKKSTIRNYSCEQIDQLVKRYIPVAKEMIIFPAISLSDTKQGDLLARVKSFYDQSLATNASYGILPVLTEKQFWTALILESGENLVDSCGYKRWTVLTYLDFAAEAISPELNQCLHQLNLPHYFLHSIHFCSAVYNADAATSGIWLIETLRHLAEEQNLIIHSIEVQTAQERQQQALNVSATNDYLSCAPSTST